MSTIGQSAPAVHTAAPEGAPHQVAHLAGTARPWAVLDRLGRVVGRWQYEEVARGHARELDVPPEVWAERWEAWDAMLPPAGYDFDWERHSRIRANGEAR